MACCDAPGRALIARNLAWQATMEFAVLISIVHSANRKGLFRLTPVFKAHRMASLDELSAAEKKIGIAIPSDLRNWLLVLGYGDIDEEMSLREEWFAAMESGPLKGGARFAQDILGNFYAFDSSGCIYFLSRSQPVFSMISRSFSEFVEELVRRDYKLVDWVNTLATQAYRW